MIEYLSISNLAVIENLEIDFRQGLNVLTGETGAGKSILIKALSLLLGSKPSSDSIRRGKEQATVFAEFKFPAQHALVWQLEKLGIDLIEDAEKIPSRKGSRGGAQNAQGSYAKVSIRRTITLSGKSKQWINGQAVSHLNLKDLAHSLVDILGQNAQTGLLVAKNHVHYLDLFLGETGRDLHTKYAVEYSTLKEELKSLEMDLSSHLNGTVDIDYLKFRVLEVDNFSPSQEDYLRLCVDVKRAEQHERLSSETESLRERSGLSDKISVDLRFILKKLLALKTTSFAEFKLDPLIALGESLLVSVEDFDFELSRFVSSLADKTFDSEMRFDEIQARLQRYQELFRKFQTSDIAQFMKATDEMRKSLDLHENFLAQISERIRGIKKRVSQTVSSAQGLSAERKKSAETLSKKVTTHLRELAMAKAQFVIDVSAREAHGLDPATTAMLMRLAGVCPDSSRILTELLLDMSTLNANGSDDVRFLLSANSGEEPKNLDKVASGGEISRVLLGIKSVFSQGADSCVLVFDEVDTGVSGLEADLIGQKIKKLSTQFQVICISHLAQVAAYADTHFKVEKIMDDESTRTKIYELSAEESTGELARLVSGKSVTERSLETARELKRSANNPGLAIQNTSKGKSPPRLREHSGN